MQHIWTKQQLQKDSFLKIWETVIQSKKFSYLYETPKICPHIIPPHALIISHINPFHSSRSLSLRFILTVFTHLCLGIKRSVSARIPCQNSTRISLHPPVCETFLSPHRSFLVLSIKITYSKERLTFRRRTFFQILAHPVFKMWVIQKPSKVALWNKRHFEEKKWRLYSMFKIFSTDICWINIKWGIWRVIFRPSYI